MRIKIRFERDAIRDFVLQHGEKVVLGGVVVAVGVMVYMALGREAYIERDPQKLIDQSNLARQHMEKTSAAANLTPRPYVEIARRIRKNVDAEPYAHTALWDAALFPQPSKRGQPKLYTVEGLRGTAGRGPFSMIGAPTDEPPTTRARGSRGGEQVTRGQRWVVLTGLLAFKRQTEAHKECFEEAQQSDAKTGNPLNNAVQYGGYWVQRAESSSGGEKEDLNWTANFSSTAAREAATKKWASRASEVVDRRYIIEKLSFPLGPLVTDQASPSDHTAAEYQVWGPEVAYRPEIPLANEQQPEEIEALPEQPPEKGNSRDPFGGNVNTEERAPRQAATQEDREQSFDYRLFRFFDYTAEPGKRYRYRVRLGLKNPNFGVDPQYLESEDLGKDEWLRTPWSEPTSVVFVPPDTQLLAVSVTPPIRARTDPSGKVMAVKWLKRSGGEAYEEFTVERGKVINYRERTFSLLPRAAPKEVKKATKDKTADKSDTRKKDKKSKNKKSKDKAEEPTSLKINYITEAMMLDLRGGGRLPGRDRTMTGPGQILLLDRDGTLVVRNELDDQAEYRRRKPTEEKAGDEATSKSGKGSGTDDGNMDVIKKKGG